MDSTALKLIQPKNSLKNSQTASQLVAHIVEELKDVSDLVKKKNDPEFIKYVCNLVENVFVEHKKQKVNKKEIALQIIQKVIPILTDDDKKVIDTIIEFLHSSKQIKRVSSVKIASYKLVHFFSSK